MRHLSILFLTVLASLAAAADLTLTSYTGQPVYGSTAITNLTAGTSFTLASGQGTVFRATGLIRLIPGFTAVTGSSFNAKLVVPQLDNIVLQAGTPPPYFANTQVQFSAIAYDQTGQPMSVPLVWSETGSGSITQAGLFSTGASLGNVTVTVASGSISQSTGLTITAKPPTAAIASTQSTYPLGYTFSGSGSQAFEGRAITSYAWAFSDGGTASGVTTTHDFPGGLSYNVTLTVTDSGGFQGSTTSIIDVPDAQDVYLSAVPITGGYNAGYTLTAQTVFQAGLGNVPASIEVGKGWRTKLQGGGLYYGFKPDRTQPAQDIYASTLLIQATTTPNPNHLFLMSYGKLGSQTHTQKFPVGKGWIDDNGSATRRPVFIPDKAQASQNIAIAQRAFTWSMPGGITPGINLTGYYLGAPITQGISLGKGWIEGRWFDKDPLIGVNDFGSATKTVQKNDHADGLDGVAPTAVYQGTFYMSPTYFISNTFSKGGPPPGGSLAGNGYLIGDGLTISFMPSGAQ